MPALNNLGISLCDLGSYDEAQVAISRAIAAKPDHTSRRPYAARRHAPSAQRFSCRLVVL
jgi:Tfp pilus assembly protein PilF